MWMFTISTDMPTPVLTNTVPTKISGSNYESEDLPISCYLSNRQHLLVCSAATVLM